MEYQEGSRLAVGADHSHLARQARYAAAVAAAVRLPVIAWCACGDGIDIRDPIARDRYGHRLCEFCQWWESEGESSHTVGPRSLADIRELARRRAP